MLLNTFDFKALTWPFFPVPIAKVWPFLSVQVTAGNDGDQMMPQKHIKGFS